MSRLFLVPVDLNKNELQNARIQNLASAPGSPVTGQVYYDTVANKLYWWNGSAWIDATGGAVTFGSVTAQTSFGASSSDGAASTAARSDHTHGTPAHDAAAHSAIKISDLAAPTAAVSFGSQRITSLADPTSAQDAATKAYVDGLANGVDWKASVRVATTANITLSGPQTIDGVSAIAGDRVLVKDQSTASGNGIYVVAAGAWSRATDADVSAEVTGGMAVWVNEGTTNGDTGWVLTTNDAITLGTTSLTFSQFTGLGQVTAGSGLTKTGNTLNIGAGTGITVNADDIAVAATYAGGSSIATVGTITSGVWNGTDIAVADGGTGASTAAGAKTNLGFMTRYAANIGDGSSTSITVTHSLGTLDVVLEVFRNSDGAKVECDVVHATTNTLTLGFASAPSSNQYRVVVIG